MTNQSVLIFLCDKKNVRQVDFRNLQSVASDLGMPVSILAIYLGKFGVKYFSN